MPADQATADALGYDATKIFHGEYGDDYISGGALNDLILGDGGNDILYGKSGNDGLGGGTGNDQLYGGAGKDLILLGTGIDYVEGGAGNDIIFAKDIDKSLLQPGAWANAPVRHSARSTATPYGSTTATISSLPPTPTPSTEAPAMM